MTGPHKVIITATEECWVHSNADHTDTRQFSLRKGDTFALTFSKSLELKLGNAGGKKPILTLGQLPETSPQKCGRPKKGKYGKYQHGYALHPEQREKQCDDQNDAEKRDEVAPVAGERTDDEAEQRDQALKELED